MQEYNTVFFQCYSQVTKFCPYRNYETQKISIYYYYNTISIVTRLWTGHPRNSSSIPGTCKRLFSSPKWPDQLSGPPSLLVNGYCRLFRQVGKQTGHEAASHLHSVPRLRMHSPYVSMAFPLITLPTMQLWTENATALPTLVYNYGSHYDVAQHWYIFRKMNGIVLYLVN